MLVIGISAVLQCSKCCSFCIWHVPLMVESLIRFRSFISYDDNIWLLRCVRTLQLYMVSICCSVWHAVSIGLLMVGARYKKQIHHCYVSWLT